MRTATNPQTGEVAVLVGDKWEVARKTATNKSGQKAYLIGDRWISDATQTQPAQQAEEKESNILPEIGRGLVRGASQIGQAINRMAPTIALGPVAGPVASKAMESIIRPGIEAVRPMPTDGASKMAGTGAEIVGAIAGSGGVSSVPTALLALASGAGGAVGEKYGGETGRVIGSLIPSAGQLAFSAPRAAKAPIVQRQKEIYETVGAQPSVGQATQSNFVQGLENLISKFPGGQGIWRRFAEKLQKDVGSSTKLGVSAESGGRAIESGARGFVERTQQVWSRLDDAVAKKIPPTAAVSPDNTLSALKDLTKVTPGAEKTTAALANPKLKELLSNISDDVSSNNGVMPYEALRAVRSKVGQMLDDAVLVSEAPKAALKKLYRALSDDMRSVAGAAGAGKAFARQNSYYSARMDRIEKVLDRVIGKTPEDTFKKFMPKDPDQANTVRAVMRSIGPEERQTVTKAVVSRLGRALPGKQDEFADVFSSETFLTNWSKLSPGAKSQLFPSNEMRRDLDEIAKVSAQLREGSKVFQNQSGTAGSFAAYSVYASPIAAAASGSLVPLLGAAGAVTAANVSSRLFTSPAVVSWLAKAPKISPAQAAGHLARLGVIASETKDPQLREDIAKLINAMSAQQDQPGNQNQGE